MSHHSPFGLGSVISSIAFMVLSILLSLSTLAVYLQAPSW